MSGGIEAGLPASAPLAGGAAVSGAAAAKGLVGALALGMAFGLGTAFVTDVVVSGAAETPAASASAARVTEPLRGEGASQVGAWPLPAGSTPPPASPRRGTPPASFVLTGPTSGASGLPERVEAAWPNDPSPGSALALPDLLAPDPSREIARPASTTAEGALAAEAREIALVRQWLASGEVGRALGLLETMPSRHPRGALEHERAALLVEALLRAGQRERARRVGVAFLLAYPQSPLAARVRQQIR